MNYSDMINDSINYIEDHLAEEISARTLAREADYSFYHYCHIFKAVTGLSPGEYIRRLRLIRAAEKIVEGMSVTEAAFLYGFDSHPGFTKAFRRHFGLPPTRVGEILNVKNQPADPSAADLLAGPPRLEHFEDQYAFGYLIEGPEKKQADDHMIPADDGGSHNDHAARAAYWDRIDFHNLPGYPEDAHDLGEIGFWWHPDDLDGQLGYFFGYVTDDLELPDGFTRISIPSGNYMIFPVEKEGDLARQIRRIWRYIFTDWFGTSNPYLFDEKGLCFELYRGEEAAVCIPVR